MLNYDYEDVADAHDNLYDFQVKELRKSFEDVIERLYCPEDGKFLNQIDDDLDLQLRRMAEVLSVKVPGKFKIYGFEVVEDTLKYNAQIDMDFLYSMDHSKAWNYLYQKINSKSLLNMGLSTDDLIDFCCSCEFTQKARECARSNA